MKVSECDDCTRLLEHEDLENLSVCAECGHLWDVRDEECSCSLPD